MQKNLMRSKLLLLFFTETVSDLTITKLSHYTAPVTGGQEVILLCDQINKGNMIFVIFFLWNKWFVTDIFLYSFSLIDDIQIIFYEENDKEITWSALGKFSPHHVHRKAAISFQTPAYKNSNVQENVRCFVHLRRPSDGTTGKPKEFILLPLIKGKLHKYTLFVKNDLFECRFIIPNFAMVHEMLFKSY